MDADQFLRMEKAIADSIEKNVNGKIRLIDQKLNDYIQADMQWKDEIRPNLEAIKNIRGFTKVSMYILGIGGALYGMFEFVYKYLIKK